MHRSREHLRALMISVSVPDLTCLHVTVVAEASIVSDMGIQNDTSVTCRCGVDRLIIRSQNCSFSLKSVKC